MPQIDKKKDLYFSKIFAHMDTSVQKDFDRLNAFFSEFNTIPNLKMHQILFKATNHIRMNLSEEERNKSKILEIEFIIKKKPKRVPIFQEVFEIWIYNPDPKPIEIHVECVFPYISNELIEKSVILDPQSASIIEFPIKIPLCEGDYPIIITGISPKKYRIFNIKSNLNVFKNLSEWTFSFEFLLT
jgi:hypothetical protein